MRDEAQGIFILVVGILAILTFQLTLLFGDLV